MDGYNPLILAALDFGKKEEYNRVMLALEHVLEDESVAHPAIDKVVRGINGFAESETHTRDGLVDAIENTRVVGAEYLVNDKRTEPESPKIVGKVRRGHD